MASLTDIIMKQVASNAGAISVPDSLKEKVLSGLGESILGSFTQTAAKPGGVDIIKNVLTGKQEAASSPLTALAGKLFANNIASKLGLNKAQSASAAGILPVVISKLSGCLKDMDGDGDVDLNDIILSLKGGSPAAAAPAGGGLLKAATSILGGLLKK